MPRIPSGEKLEDPMRERCVSRVRIEELADAKQHRNHLNGGGEHGKYRVINRRFAQKEQRNCDGCVNQSRYQNVEVRVESRGGQGRWIIAYALAGLVRILSVFLLHFFILKEESDT